MTKPSPKNLKLGTTETFDNKKYIVSISKNIKKKWVSYTKSEKKKEEISITNAIDFFDIPKIYTPSDLGRILENEPNSIIKIFEKIIKLVPKLKKIWNFVRIFINPYDEKRQLFWSDYIDAYFAQEDKNWHQKKFYIFEIKIQNEKLVPPHILIHYKHINLNEKQETLNIYKKYLPNNFKWDGNNNSSMYISYFKLNPPTDFNMTLKENDTYPTIYIALDFPSKTFNIRKPLTEQYETIKKLDEKIKEISDIGEVTFDMYSIEYMRIQFDATKKQMKEILDLIINMKEPKLLNYTIEYVTLDNKTKKIANIDTRKVGKSINSQVEKFLKIFK